MIGLVRDGSSRNRCGVAQIVVGTIVLLLLAALTAPLAADSPPCPGDCNGDRAVTVDEIVKVVNIALGVSSIDGCRAADTDGNSQVSVDELVTMINFALNGCLPFEPLPQEWQEAVDTSTFGWVMSAWGPGDGSLWIVGGGLFEGRILHKHAATWSEVELGFRVPLLNWVHGTSGSDVFVGGNDGTILHFDGSEWRLQATPTTLPVWGLWALAPDDVWAVGGDNARTTPPLVMRFDGVAWAIAEFPPLLRPRVHAFFKVWAADADNVWMVGQNGVILGFNGETFTEFGAGISQDLIGIWGTGPHDITTVGGRGTAEFAHYDGDRWRRAPQTGLPGLNGVWTRRSDVAHAVGVAGTVLRLAPSDLSVLETVAVPTDLELHAVFGDASGQILALGANFNFPERGVILHRALSATE